MVSLVSNIVVMVTQVFSGITSVKYHCYGHTGIQRYHYDKVPGSVRSTVRQISAV